MNMQFRVTLLLDLPSPSPFAFMGSPEYCRTGQIFMGFRVLSPSTGACQTGQKKRGKEMLSGFDILLMH